jgi:hypothetical protein
MVTLRRLRETPAPLPVDTARRFADATADRETPLEVSSRQDVTRRRRRGALRARRPTPAPDREIQRPTERSSA